MQPVKITICPPGDSSKGGGFSAAVKSLRRKLKGTHPGSRSHSFSCAAADALSREFRAITGK